MNRRTLLKQMVLHSLAFPLALEAKNLLAAPLAVNSKRLILIELKGGNDGLNTVVPYQDPNYYKLRPNISVDKNAVLALSPELALHPSLLDLKDIFDRHELAIIQGVGYPDPNRSHFRSIDIWDTASSSHQYLDRGWLTTFNKEPLGLIKGVVLGGDYGPLTDMPRGVIKINNLKQFLQQSKKFQGQIYKSGKNEALHHILKTETEIRSSAEVLRQYISNRDSLAFKFPRSTFGNQMRVVTELSNSSVGASLYKVSLGSFDTHVNQSKKHAALLKELSQGIAIMRKNLMQSGQWDNTLIMTYSEFGRRAAENANKGSDHGTAAPHFVLGGKVKGGLYGTYPSLSSLDGNGDLIYTTDFRSMYKSVVNEWFQVSSPLVEQFPSLHIL